MWFDKQPNNPPSIIRFWFTCCSTWLVDGGLWRQLFPSELCPPPACESNIGGKKVVKYEVRKSSWISRSWLRKHFSGFVVCTMMFSIMQKLLYALMLLVLNVQCASFIISLFVCWAHSSHIKNTHKVNKKPAKWMFSCKQTARIEQQSRTSTTPYIIFLQTNIDLTFLLGSFINSI